MKIEKSNENEEWLEIAYDAVTIDRELLLERGYLEPHVIDLEWERAYEKALVELKTLPTLIQITYR